MDIFSENRYVIQFRFSNILTLFYKCLMSFLENKGNNFCAAFHP